MKILILTLAVFTTTQAWSRSYNCKSIWDHSERKEVTLKLQEKMFSHRLTGITVNSLEGYNLFKLGNQSIATAHPATSFTPVAAPLFSGVETMQLDGGAVFTRKTMYLTKELLDGSSAEGLMYYYSYTHFCCGAEESHEAAFHCVKE